MTHKLANLNTIPDENGLVKEINISCVCGSEWVSRPGENLRRMQLTLAQHIGHLNSI